MNLNIEAV